MKKIAFIGDAHGKISNLVSMYEFLDKENIPSIQLGDMGCGFVQVPECGRKFIRGNHDDPAIARSHKDYLGDYGYLADYGIFYIGGAFSIDAAWRQYAMREGGKPCWWADEELDYATLQAAVDYYIQHKPKIVVSHECPSKAGIILLQLMQQRLYKEPCTRSRTAAALQTMFEAHQPKLWVFGHYHFDKSFLLDKTTFLCLNELSCTILDTDSVEEESKIRVEE